MLRSIAAQDAQDDYLRLLLDRRAAPADLYPRFSSPDTPDTPSVYSRSFLSPRPQDRAEPASPSNPHPLSSHAHIASDRERLNDPSFSSLDFDDDSYVYNTTTRDDSDADSITRMSLLGPKMRFHSRAPWEAEEETLHEEDETALGVVRPKISTKFFNFGSSSPRPSNLSRPSGESSRSEVTSKVSMDRGLHSKGMAYTRNQGSISNCSLGRPSSSGRSDRVRKSSLGPPSSVISTPPSPGTISSPRSRFSSSANSIMTSQTSFGYGNRRESADNSRMFLASPTPSEMQQRFHPYANPDLVASSEVYDSTDSLSTSHEIVSSESATTVTESSTAGSVPRTAYTLTPDSSTSSVDPKNSVSTLHGREISTPVVVLGHVSQRDRTAQTDAPAPLLPGVQHLPGWKENNNTPSFALISLEEARAQRARSVTQPSSTGSVGLNGDSTSSYPGPEATHTIQCIQPPQQNLTVQRSRARSVSTGVRAKNALHTVIGTQFKSDKHDAEPISVYQGAPAPGKILKHRKSGFMRLLIGNRIQEERAQPPPVPMLPDTLTSHQSPQQAVPRNLRVHRVPVPKIINAQETANDVSPSRPATSPERSRPQLSIGTTSSGIVPQAFASAFGEYPKTQFETPWSSNDVPHSAPADVVDFPALQLRPVSTLFSAHFEDHLAKPGLRPSLETDTDAPRSSSSHSPVTPRSGVEQGRSNITETDDQSAVIRALQEHITSAKVASQRQIRELEGQVRDLKAQVDRMKAVDTESYCEACGRGKPLNKNSNETKSSVVNRPRARTGSSARFGSSTA